MKFGRFIYRYTGEYHAGKEAIYNIGDNIQTIAIDNLYKICGINEEDIVDLNIAELTVYDGAYCIVPMAGYFSSYSEFDQLPVSGRIIPLFISTELGYTECKDLVPFLKKWEPVWARDEATLQNLRKYGIESCLSGCLTITLPKRYRKPENGRGFLIDLSDAALTVLPRDYRENGEIVHHVGRLEKTPMDEEERLRVDGIVRRRL